MDSELRVRALRFTNFTNMECSTRLWKQDLYAMRAVMARHGALLCAIIEQHDGVVMRPCGAGDSLFCVFLQASDAMAVALAGQRGLAADGYCPAVAATDEDIRRGRGTLNRVRSGKTSALSWLHQSDRDSAACRGQVRAAGSGASALGSGVSRKPIVESMW